MNTEEPEPGVVCGLIVVAYVAWMRWEEGR